MAPKMVKGGYCFSLIYALVFLWVSPLWCLESSLIPADTPEGIKRLERSKAKADFMVLANHFERQKNPYFCGVASSVIVLNALNPKDRLCTQNDIFNSETDKVKTKAQVMGKNSSPDIKPDYGFQLAQLDRFLEARGVRSDERVVDAQIPPETMRQEIIGNLKQPGNYVLVNYHRKALGQDGGGHISPLGAYDEESDSVLIMDVNPTRAPWVWTPLPRLIQAMNTLDEIQNRGYLLVGSHDQSAVV